MVKENFKILKPYISFSRLTSINHNDMTIEAKIKAKKILSYGEKISITITDENDNFLEEKEFSNYDELVSEVEYNEEIGNGVYL
jgi:hypothetical protein